MSFIRRRAGRTQLELSVAVCDSDAQICWLEQKLPLPEPTTIKARFVPGLYLESRAVTRFSELAAAVMHEDMPEPGLCPFKGLNYFDEVDTDSPARFQEPLDQDSLR